MELERLLGGPLVERNRQNVGLTPLGTQVVKRAQSLLADARELMTLAQELAAPCTGDFQLGIIPTIAPFVLPQLLPAVQQAMPKLNLLIHEAQSAVLYERLQQGQLDAALLALPFQTDNLHVIPLWDEPMQLVCRHDDPILQQSKLEVAQFPLDRLLLLEEGHCLRDHVLSACSWGDKPNPDNPTLRASSLPTLLAMVAAGRGFTLLPQMALATLSLDQALEVHPLTDQPYRTLALLCRRSTTRQPEIEQLTRLLQAQSGLPM